MVALWRESLLARAVLAGKTKGYRHHPQLTRFRSHPLPEKQIGAYLIHLWQEAQARGFNFDRTKISGSFDADPMPVTSGQLLFEWQHLQKKLIQRKSPQIFTIKSEELPETHPLFYIIPGQKEEWEKDTGL